jgi:hypothetical protein
MDSLFEQHSVQQVKLHLIKLKKDAEKRNSEVRLMIGDRYQDILKNSNFIKSMNSDLKLLLDNLHQLKDNLNTTHHQSVQSNSRLF